MEQVLQMAAVSGGRTNTFFASRPGSFFKLGQQPDPAAQALYNQAVADVAQWNQLVQRLAMVANVQVANQIAATYGLNDPTNQDKGEYTANGVQVNINTANSYTPVNYEVFAAGDVKHRVARLESYLSDFRHDVESAEATYGEARVINNTIVQQGSTTGGSSLPDWVLPVGLGAGGLVLLVVSGVIKLPK